MADQPIWPKVSKWKNSLPHSSKPISEPESSINDNHDLPRLITQAASKQTYFTIRYLVDRERVHDAYRAYAYFRWLDDTLDKNSWTKPERLDFVVRQQKLVDNCYHGQLPADLSPEEEMLTNLIGNNSERETGIEYYVRHMMAVMAFDAKRRGCLISQQQLTQYSTDLAIAVTEALHYFIGHDDPAPHVPSRYLAVVGAHVTHMLRDSVEDVAAGYF